MNARRDVASRLDMFPLLEPRVYPNSHRLTVGWRLLYMLCPHMGTTALERELKRGSTELLILALIEDQPRHGYEIGRLIEERSEGTITFHIASLYPTLYRLEDRGLIEGRWVERPEQRRRKYYRLTAQGRKVLSSQRSVWREFFTALDRVARIRHA